MLLLTLHSIKNIACIGGKVMLTAVGLFESPSIKDTLKSQFKRIKKSKVTIDTVQNELIQRLDDKYNCIKSNYEIMIKVDKRKNIEQVKNEVQNVLNEIEVTFDMIYLFKVKVGQNEIIVRARRNK
jgi:hypothetical protein